MRLTAKEFLERFPDHPASKTIRERAKLTHQGSRRSAAKLAGKSVPSPLEEKLARDMRGLKLDANMRREHAFCPGRRWRFDFAWPHLWLAVEVEGGIWGRGGRHNKARGFIADTEKYNTAAAMGWTVLRFAGPDVNSGSAARAIEDMIRNRMQDEKKAAAPRQRPIAKAVGGG